MSTYYTTYMSMLAFALDARGQWSCRLKYGLDSVLAKRAGQVRSAHAAQG